MSTSRSCLRWWSTGFARCLVRARLLPNSCSASWGQANWLAGEWIVWPGGVAEFRMYRPEVERPWSTTLLLPVMIDAIREGLERAVRSGADLELTDRTWAALSTELQRDEPHVVELSGLGFADAAARRLLREYGSSRARLVSSAEVDHCLPQPPSRSDHRQRVSRDLELFAVRLRTPGRPRADLTRHRPPRGSPWPTARLRLPVETGNQHGV